MLHTASGAGDKDHGGPGLTLPTPQRERPLKSTVVSADRGAGISLRTAGGKAWRVGDAGGGERLWEVTSRSHSWPGDRQPPREAEACLPPDAHAVTGLTDELHLSPRQGFAQHLPDRSRDNGPLEDQDHIPFFIFPQGLTRGSEHSIEPELVSQWCSQRLTGLLKITWFLAAGQGQNPSPLTVALRFPLQCWQKGRKISDPKGNGPA